VVLRIKCVQICGTVKKKKYLAQNKHSTSVVGILLGTLVAVVGLTLLWLLRAGDLEDHSQGPHLALAMALSPSVKDH
jgi:hypothetical protein